MGAHSYVTPERRSGAKDAAEAVIRSAPSDASETAGWAPSLGLVIAGLGLFGCSPDSSVPPRDAVVRRDSAGIELVENGNAGVWGPGEAWTVDEAFSIGQLDGPTEYTLNSVSAASLGPTSELFVLDSGDNLVRVYSTDGRHLRTFGDEGEGPGEFQGASLLVLRGDTVIVLDWRARRLTRFATDGTLIRTDRTDLSPFEYGFPEQLAVTEAGRWIAAAGTGCALPRRETGDTMWKLLSLDDEGLVSDTLRLVQRRDMIAVYGEEPNVFCTTIAIPFGPSPAMAVSADGRLAIGDGSEYRFALFHLGEHSTSASTPLGAPERIVRREVELALVTREHIQDVEDRYTSPEGPDHRNEAIRNALGSVELPGRWPAFVRMLFDRDGHLWVQRPKPGLTDGATTPELWDIFAPDGSYLGEIALPPGVRVLEVSADLVVGRLTDDLGIQYVQGFRLNKP